jgi:proline dehydrogenase
LSVMRSILLAASQNVWMRERAGRYKFVRRSVSRFMPGEEADDAIRAAKALAEKRIGGVLSHLGENIRNSQEAEDATRHYLTVLGKIQASGMQTELSVKLTQLGLDQSVGLCSDNLHRILKEERPEKSIWIDMEASSYVDATLEVYRRALAKFPRTGICLQAYLFRSRNDLDALLPLHASVRLVKGAYKEPPEVAIPAKKAVDDNFFALAQTMVRAQRDGKLLRAIFGTHDTVLIRRLAELSATEGLPQQALEIQMLYGIQRVELERLATEGYRAAAFICYGHSWYPWFIRRLAERPANLWFVAKNLFGK